MNTSRKLIVGYDLCEDYTQISCYSYKSKEPVPISDREKDEKNLIPTILCRKGDTGQWLAGEEAVRCSEAGQGMKVEQLLMLLASGKETELYGRYYSAPELLEQYFRRTLALVKKYFPVEPITKLVVTIRDYQPEFACKIYPILETMGLKQDRVVIISHARAYLYYALCQESTLWKNDVGLFDFSREGMVYYQIKLNRRQHPVIAGLSRSDYTDLMSYDMIEQKRDSLGYIMENITNQALHKQIVTTLYFTGSGFDGGWAEPLMKELCAGRRVFLGQNLFTKGACYAAKELAGDRQLEEFLLLDDDMITGTIEVRVYQDTKFKEKLLAGIGEVWYEIDKSIEVIPEGEPELEIIRKSILSREIVRDKLHLTKLPGRPDRMTRLELHLTCKDKSTGVIQVNDLGFGELYPGTGCIMEFTIEIG